MARRRKPVVNRGADAPALDGWIAGPMMAGDQQQDAIAGADRPLERAIDRLPGGVEGHAVEVEHAVRLDRAAAKPLVPAAVEGGAT